MNIPQINFSHSGLSFNACCRSHVEIDNYTIKCDRCKGKGVIKVNKEDHKSKKNHSYKIKLEMSEETKNSTSESTSESYSNDNRHDNRHDNRDNNRHDNRRDSNNGDENSDDNPREHDMLNSYIKKSVHAELLKYHKTTKPKKNKN